MIEKALAHQMLLVMFRLASSVNSSESMRESCLNKRGGFVCLPSGSIQEKRMTSATGEC